METTTPFDLNLAIQQWRENLGKAPALSSENVAELEGHLRDSVSALEARGLSSEEAFVVACKRIGKVSSLAVDDRCRQPGYLLVVGRSARRQLCCARQAIS